MILSLVEDSRVLSTDDRQQKMLRFPFEGANTCYLECRVQPLSSDSTFAPNILA